MSSLGCHGGRQSDRRHQRRRSHSAAKNVDELLWLNRSLAGRSIVDDHDISFRLLWCVSSGREAAQRGIRFRAAERRCDADSVFELQYVLPEDEKSWERSGRIVAFIRIGLTELGLAHYRDAVGTAVACACVARGDPVAAARFATARFLSGQYGLYAGFGGCVYRIPYPS